VPNTKKQSTKHIKKAKCQAQQSTMHNRAPHTKIPHAQNLCVESLKVTSSLFFAPPKPKPNWKH
jgi:hypothetical protein